MAYLGLRAGLAAALCTAAAAIPQPVSATRPADRYLQGRSRAMDALGYLSLGPFSWGDDHGTRAIEGVLGRELLWVETAHFKIGSGLQARPLPPDSNGRRGLYEDLDELHRRLRSFPSRPRTLDPWLLLHLQALRAERLYRDLTAELGLPPREAFARGGKFRLLLLETEGDLVRYTAQFFGADRRGPYHHRCIGRDCQLVVTTGTLADGRLLGDEELRPHVAFHTTRSLLDGLTVGGRGLPLWFRDGLCLLFSRRVDPDYTGDRIGQHAEPPRPWEPLVWGRVRHGTGPGFDDLLQRGDSNRLSQVERAMAWSRTRYLMQLDQEGFARFVAFCGQHPPRRPWMPYRLAYEWHERALGHAFGLTVEEFETGWRRHVLGTYSHR